MNKLTMKGKVYLSMTCFLMVLESWISVTYTYHLAQILVSAQEYNADKTLEMVIKTIALLVGIFLVRVFVSICRMKYLSDGEIKIKIGIMRGILKKTTHEFREKPEAYYMNLLTNDIDMYRGDFLSPLPFVFSSASAFLFSAIALHMLNPWLMLTGLFLAFLPLGINKLFVKLEAESKNRYSKEAEKHMATMKETLEGFAAIRYDNNADVFLKRNMEAVKKKRYAQSYYAFIADISSETFYSFASLSNIIGLGVGAVLVLKGILNPLLMIAAQSYLVSLSNHVSNIGAYVTRILSTKEISQKLEAEMTEEEQKVLSHSKEDIHLIEYKNVSFGFNDRMLYKRFNCQLKEKGCYVIVGESGSGKSTLVKLLLKQYENYEGNIYIGEKDIRELTEQEICSYISFVNQESYVFNASLYENITMFSNHPEKDSAQYEALLRSLNLQELAMRVGDAPLGDFGDNISGGERQRICLARMLRHHRPIVIFDEPTSGLDPENVRLINEFIFGYKDALRIVISHDWSKEYLNRFDEIIQIKNV